MVIPCNQEERKRMAKAIMVVHTRPVSEDKEDQYNEWYTEEHLADVVSVPGFGSARRFVLSETPAVEGLPPNGFKYMAIYELDTDDVEGAAKAMGEALPGMHLSEALDATAMEADFFVPIEGAERTAE